MPETWTFIQVQKEKNTRINQHLYLPMAYNYLTKPSKTSTNSKSLTTQPQSQETQLWCYNNSHNQIHRYDEGAIKFQSHYHYKNFINSHITATKTTIPTTDKSMHMQEQPPFIRLFKTAKFFCTRCLHHNRNRNKHVF